MSRAGDLRTFSVFDFRRGLDLQTSPLTLSLVHGQNSLTKADNTVYTQSGGATKRYDQTTLTTSSVGASVAITGGKQFNKSDGTSQVIFGTDDGRLYKLNTDGSTTAQVTGLTTGKTNYFDVYNDKLLWGNRADAPKKYDGTTWAALGGSPPATGGPLAVHGNRVFWLDATNKSALTWSALNAEEDYTTPSNAGSTTVSANDGSDLIALQPSINELILLKGRRPYRLQGTNPSTFATTNVVPTTGSVGAVSSTAATFAVNDVWYAASNGIVTLSTVLYFGDLRAKFASQSIFPYWQPNSGYTLSLQNLSSSVMAYDSQNNRIYAAFDSDADGKNDILLVYDLITTGWSVWPNQSIASMWPVKSATTGLIEIYSGTYTGHVKVFNRSVSTNAIDGHVRHLSALAAPGVEKSPRYGFLYFKEQGNVSVTVDTKFDFGKSGGQTYSVSLLGNSHTLGVNWVLGTDPLGSQQQVVKRVDMRGTGEFVELGVRNQNAGQPFTWYGYEVMWRPRRTVRRAS